MRRLLAALFVTATAAAAVGTGATAVGAPAPQAQAQGHAPVCPGAASPETARCNSDVVTDAKGKPLVTSGPSGYGPADLQSAYNVPSTPSSTWTWNGKTVAIVDAYHDPTAAGDLSVYRSTLGLPPCTVASGCFKQVNQNGGTAAPRTNGGWAQEISLDLDMASAICPYCKIILVEASSASFANLGTAVNRAASMGATAISNSYGGSEFSSETSSTYASYYNHPGIAITVSSGDNGYGVEFPAASPTVTAVGGTHLTKNGTAWSETAWSGAGSGCSAYVPKPSWQHDSCSKRTVADVSAVADPNTGVSVYDSTSYQGYKGWMVFGGTSVASPIVASVYALAAGNGNALNASSAYANPGALHDVTSGSNGSCGGSYLCTATTGYDGPTGLGTPNGTGAF